MDLLRLLKSVALLLCLLVSAPYLFLSCNGEADSPPPVTTVDTLPHIDLDSILARGKIRALTDFSSTSYFIYKGVPMGYEYDLLTQMAEHLGVDLEIVIVEDLDSIFTYLEQGKGDIVAANITVTKERARRVDFTERLLTSRQVLIQRLPDNWNRMMTHQIERSLVRNQLDLIGKKVRVRKGTSFYTRLQSLSDEIGGDIIIEATEGDVETEQLIGMVAKGEIEYTVADEHVARLNKIYYPNIDIRTSVSFPQQIAWVVRKDHDGLLHAINEWIVTNRNRSDFATIYAKYFRSRRKHRDRVQSDFSSLSGGKISAYDDLIKGYSHEIGWDWRLVAALIYQESRFDLEAESWMGARGLMQILPETAALVGVDSMQTPEDNLKAGILYLKKLEDYWLQHLEDPFERKKFVLASYNVGLGHIIDAQRLADKHGFLPLKWERNVEQMVLLKARPAYYNDEVVRHGYCRGTEPVKYVKEVLQRYEHYRNGIKA